MKQIKIDDIAIDGGTQQREIISDTEVEAYAEAMRCGAQFPPVVLFFDGAQYWLADGFHRYHAHRAAEISIISADVRTGTKRDARLFSAGANGAHGMRLTNADKRKAVMVLLGDLEWSAWSDSTIARHCNVTQPFVGKLRNELSPKTKTCKPNTSITVIGDAQETAPALEVEKQKAGDYDPEALPSGTKNAPSDDTNPKTGEHETDAYNPADNELDEAHETIRSLAAENDALKDRIAAESMNASEEEKTAAVETMATLRAEIVALERNLTAVTASRDQLMRENGELKKQCQMQQRELKKLRTK